MLNSSRKKVLSYPYARAFLRTYQGTQKELFADIDALLAAHKTTPVLFHTLHLSSIHVSEKCKGLAVLSKRLQISQSMHHLLATMLRKKAMYLLPSVLVLLKREYKKINNQHDVVVTSARTLTRPEKDALEAQLRVHIFGTLSFTYHNDNALISGIKVQTATHYWEFSIARTIRMLQHRLHSQGTI